MVVASKPALHVYRIRDREGKKPKKVHCNLLLPSQFSALGYLSDDDTPPAVSLTNGPSVSSLPETTMSAVNTGAAKAEPCLADSLFCVSEPDSNHTASWVQQQSPADAGPETDLDPLDVTPSPEPFTDPNGSQWPFGSGGELSMAHLQIWQSH